MNQEIKDCIKGINIELSENNKLQNLKGRQKKIISDLGRRQDKIRMEIDKRKEGKLLFKEC